MQDLKTHPALIQVFASRLKNLSREGNKYLALCPFHDDHNPSLLLSKNDKGVWVFHCFSCNAGGDTVKFVQDFDRVSPSKAIKTVEEAIGGDWQEVKARSDNIFRKLEETEEPPSATVSLEKYIKFEIGLYESKEAQEWLFRERGITYEAARTWHFGFCQNLDSVTKLYDKEKLKDIADKGWITFAAVEGDKVLCIEARSIIRKETRIRTGMSNKVLFGVDNISWDEPIFVTEGKFDACILTQAGFKAISLPNASANLTTEMRDKLTSASSIILAGDNDGGAGSAKMLKLFNEIQSRTYMITWPKGTKDANEVFLKDSKRDIEAFRKTVDSLVIKAYSNPMQGVKSLQEILTSDKTDSAENREDRFHFSIKSLDKMANIFPGAVVYVTAASTGSGKTQIVLQETLFAARKRDAVVLNYQTQLQGEEIGTIATANLLAKDRNSLTREDRLEAAKRLKGVQYYVGHDPSSPNLDATLDLIEAGIRRLGANIVVIDLIHDLCQGERDEIKAQAKAMRRIKLMMQKYLAIAIVIGQPRKVDPKNAGKPLDIYDSKGSEALVSESDAIFYMYREPIKNMTEDTEDRLSPEVQIRCMKARNKGNGKAMAKLFFLGKIATFREIVPIEEPTPRSYFDTKLDKTLDKQRELW